MAIRQVNLRLDDQLLPRLEKAAESMSRPGLKLTRSDVIRIFIEEGLARLRAEERTKKRR